jgi:hypothetical protein
MPSWPSRTVLSVLLLQAVLIALGAKNDGAFALTNCARVNISELW